MAPSRPTQFEARSVAEFDAHATTQAPAARGHRVDDPRLGVVDEEGRPVSASFYVIGTSARMPKRPGPPLGPTRTITGAEQNVLFSIDGRPALDPRPGRLRGYPAKRLRIPVQGLRLPDSCQEGP